MALLVFVLFEFFEELADLFLEAELFGRLGLFLALFGGGEGGDQRNDEERRRRRGRRSLRPRS